jgi:hypothetical protein
MAELSERDEHRIELAKAFLRAIDEHGDLTPLITEDLEMTFPKWGTCYGTKDFPRYFADLGSYIAKIQHHPESFLILTGDNHVAIEGLSSGELTNGERWPNKEATGSFCSVFGFWGDRICTVRIHIDPDYTDATADHYAWRRERAAAAA